LSPLLPAESTVWRQQDARLSPSNATLLVIPADVSDADATENVAIVTEKELGPIDIWVNVAMVSVFSPFTKMTPAEV